MLDAFNDWLKGRVRVAAERDVEHVGEFFFDPDGTKFLCVAVTRTERGRMVDLDQVDPISASKVAKYAAIFIATVVSTLAPLYWILRVI